MQYYYSSAGSRGSFAGALAGRLVNQNALLRSAASAAWFLFVDLHMQLYQSTFIGVNK